MKKSTLSRIFTAAIIALGALLCLTACGGGAQSQSENSTGTTSASTVLTTTASDESESTAKTTTAKTTTAESKTTTTTAQTTTATEATTTAVTTTTVAQTTTQATPTVSTTKADQNPPTVTTSYVLPNTATYVDIDIVVDDNNNAAVAVMFLQSYGIDTTVQEIAPYVTGCTTEETFAEGITTFLTFKGIQKKAEIIVTDEISSVVDGAYFTDIIHMFFYNGMPIVVYAVDDFNVYTIENGVLMGDDDATFMAKYSGRYVKIL